MNLHRRNAANNQDYVLSGAPLNEENIATDSEIALSENITLNDDDVFIYPSDHNITEHLDDVFSIVNYHNAVIAPKYRMKRDYYKGRHHAIIKQPKKPLNKPDSRQVINLPKKLVNTFNGYFSGDPVSIKFQSEGKDSDTVNEAIQSWLNDNDYADAFSEWAKQADIYGRSYLYVYMIEGELKFTICSPRDTIVVYDDTVMHNPMFGIRYSSSSKELTPTLITPKATYKLAHDEGQAVIVTNADKSNPQTVVKEDLHNFPTLQLIELAEDDERTGLFDDTLNLVDSIDQVLSSKNNDIVSFADEYLVINGVQVKEEQLNMMADQRVINLYPEDNNTFTNDGSPDFDVKFLAPDSNDETQENFLNRAIDLVYQISQVVNLNDSTLGASAQSISGVALLQRYQPMQAKARTKALKMDKALRALFTIKFAINGPSGVDVSDLTFDHKQSIPHNVSEEADIVTKLDGQVSDATKLGYLSGIDDPAKEVERLKQEDKDRAKEFQSQNEQYLNDQQKKAGVDSVDLNSPAGATKNSAIDQSGQPNGRPK